MKRRKQLYWISALLALLLTAGPLQARVMYLCTVMDTVVHDQCSCSDHDECADSDCSDLLYPGDASCCDRTIMVTADGDVLHSVPGSHRSGIQSDVDPPAAVFTVTSQFSAPYNFSPALVVPHSASSALSGPNTYLVTQRLRI